MIEGSSIGNFNKQAANLKINKINFVGRSLLAFESCFDFD